MSHNTYNFTDLRNTHPVFSYDSFEYKVVNRQLSIQFTFSIGPEIIFKPTLQIPLKSFFKPNSLTKDQLDLLVFHLGMIELISYWKCTCSEQLIIRPVYLDDIQLSFFKKVYFHGLGEFFYLNGIDTTMESFMNIQSVSDKKIPLQRFDLREECIIPIGGGKDSVVSLELIKESPFSITPLIINPRGATIGCVHEGGYTMEETIEIYRTIDPLLLDLNKKGYLNGHTPFSAVLAFTTLLCAALTQKKHIALSNESSANETTVPDSSVNHQYSKSLEFEKDFKAYVNHYISQDINYFSFLRPLNELQIASLFALYPQYTPVFRSCNVGSKTNSWCGNCPKCLFAYIILSPFIEPNKMISIFGKNVWNDAHLQPYFDQLTGQSNIKPFECVGTIEEVQAALILTIERFYRHFENRPLLLQNVSFTDDYVIKSKSLLSRFEQEHYLNPTFLNILKNKMENL